MKRVNNKLLVFLFSAVILLALPLKASAKSSLTEMLVPMEDSIAESMPATGYIPGKIHGASVISNAYKLGDMETYLQLTGNQTDATDTLPSTYDSRNYSYVTSVKNQNPYGSCWAHAAMASIESYMIKYGVPVGSGAAATTSLNLSETQHCFFNYTNAYDAEGLLTGDKSAALQDNCLDQGGNGEMSAYTLMRWAGAASESESALAYSKASTVASSGLGSQYAYGSNVSHVQNSVWIPGSSVEDVKRAIMEYGAGNISYYETGNAYTYICTKDTSSQSSSYHKWANHAITVVGWDDTISVKSGFRPNTPSKPGAWICKNSWGTNYFNSGYCYISYEDTSVLEGYIYFYDAESVDNYDHNYQYDGSCNVVCYGKGEISSSGSFYGFANGTKVANVFTAKGSESLKAVALCNWDEALTYTLEIYKNPQGGNPSSGTLMTSQNGYITFSGYYTIPLNEEVPLSEGDTFSVVFTQNVAAADDAGYYVHTPYDASYNNTSVISWASFVHADHGATSFYQEPGGAWKDCPDNGDYRIKAYTVDREEEEEILTVSFSVPAGIAAPQAVSCTAGNAVLLPAAAAPAGYTFLGWVENVVNSDTVQPDFLSGSYTPAGNITLKALYSQTVAEEPGYRLLTSSPSDWNGKYIITYGRGADAMVLKGIKGTKKYETQSAGGAVSLAESGMTLEGTTLKNANDLYLFTVADAEGKLVITNEETGTYLASKGGYLYSYKADTPNYCRWSFSTSGGTVCAMNASSRTFPYLAFSAAKNYFMISRSADPNICLWKMAEATSFTVYTTEIL